MEYNFVRTSDEETKKCLLKEGFQLLSKSGDVYTFINNDTSTFDKDNKKIQYTNTLHI